MAKRGRKAKIADQTIGANRSDEDYLGWVEKIEGELTSIDSLRGSFMNSCRGHQESIKRIKKMCKAEGGSVVVLLDLLAERKHERKKAERRAEMTPDDAKQAALLSDKFVRQTDLFEADDDKATNTVAFLANGGKTDADRLAEGIRPLNS